MLSRRRWFFGAALVAALIGGGSAVAGAVSGSSAPAAVKQLFTPAASGVSPVLHNDFAVFRRVPAGQASLPAGAAIRLSSGGPFAGYGLDLAQTQYVTMTPAFRVWLVPGTRGVCMVWRQPDPLVSPTALMTSSDCGSLTAATSGEFGSTSTISGPSGSTTFMVRLVPDGNETASASTDTGATVQLPVTDNVLYVANATGVRDVQTRNAAGDVQTSSPSRPDEPPR
jgi:hypothetical protein